MSRNFAHVMLLATRVYSPMGMLPADPGVALTSVLSQGERRPFRAAGHCCSGVTPPTMCGPGPASQNACRGCVRGQFFEASCNCRMIFRISASSGGDSV